MRVAILGAGGLIGRRLTQFLRTKSGVEVIACLRKRPRYRGEVPNVEFRQFEGTDWTSVNESIHGATHVVNCVMGASKSMIASTRNLCNSAMKRGGIQVVHFSSCAVFGAATGIVDERTRVGSGVDWYGKAKIECEEIIQDFVRKGLMATILRPSCVYGPGSRLWTIRIGRMLKSHRLGDLGVNGDGRCNLIYLDDIVAAVWETMTKIKQSGEVFVLSNTNPPTWNEYLIDYGRAIGAIPIHRLPPWQLDFECKLLAAPITLIRRLSLSLDLSFDWIPDAITPSLLRIFQLNAIYNSIKARRYFTYEPTPYRQGLKESAEWLITTSPRNFNGD
jgi:2-alkyl-3-oxoalkanoate reductase